MSERQTVKTSGGPPTGLAASRGTGTVDLAAKTIKVTVVLDAAAVARITVPNGASHMPFAVSAAGRRLTGQFNAKTLRKAVTMVAEHGAENVAVIVQDKLAAGDRARGGRHRRPGQGAAIVTTKPRP